MSGSTDGAYRFNRFVVGSSNRLAVSAARAVAESPGTAYNPLFVYGPSGLGKTHLVAAIAHEAQARRSALQVAIRSGEDLAEELHRAIAGGAPEQLAQRFRSVGLLVIDDVQFLTGQRETQTALLRLLNGLLDDGRQLVLTSDRPPADIPDVDQRLLSRLSGGLIVDVGAPDFEMRLAILRNATGERALNFGAGVLEEVARLAFGNVRELKGALNKLTAFQLLDGRPIAPDDVRAVLGERPRAMNDASTGAPEVAAEYEGFLADVFQEVETRVEPWRVRLGESCAFWRGAGYKTAVLERALAYPVRPDVDGLLETFAAAIEHLRTIEVQAVRLDPTLRGQPAFHDPEAVAEAQALLNRAIAGAQALPAPSPTLTRATLETGSANQLAMKAFDVVIASPGKRYNPLLVHGPSGVGKSHFLHALGHAMCAAWPTRTVACLSSSTLVEELVVAMQAGGVERWRARFRLADVLILDDVQLLTGKERTQEELFHLFNHLFARGGQIVLSADRPPRELHGLADRLRSRFEGGLVVAMQTPDRALRKRLVQRWLLDADEDPTEPLVAFLADREVTSARELRGLITRLCAAAELSARPLSLDMAQSELGVPRVAAAAHDAASGARHAFGDIDGHPDDFFLDREKVIWDWPDIGGRLIEELR